MKNPLHHLSPQQFLPLSFLAFIFLGTGLLLTPWATHSGHISFIDALFTATSAVCVTGLVVVDTGNYFTGFGQGLILGLVQVGGLGIMTFSVFFYMLLGAKVSLKQRLVVQNSFSHYGRYGKSDVVSLLSSIFLYTFLIEGVGALLLFFCWSKDYPFSVAWFYAAFHSISAFCNAGFCLFSDSLVRYRDTWCVNFVILALIVAGGLGFIVLQDIINLVTKRNGKVRPRLSLHSKIVLSSTLFLIVGGAVLFFVLEIDNVLVGVPVGGKVLSSFFQSITCRTAGFNTVDLYYLANPTLFIFIILMFIGASPGSCGGGVKTINAAILVIMAKNRLKGNDEGEVFKRTIPRETLSQAITIIISAVVLISIIACLLMISETGHHPHPETRGKFLEYLFETVSAFGTVGLSMGVTSKLTTVGKVLIIVMMFLGRIGPLNLAYSLARRGGKKKFQYGEEKVLIG